MTVGKSVTRTPRNWQLLLETAAREFVSVGYERASLNAIIGTCQMSKSSFYHYFDSKATLFDSVVEHAADHLRVELDAPSPEELSGAEFWHRITKVCQRLVAVAARENWYADFGRLFYLSDAPVQHSPATREVTSAIHDWIQRALEVGRECGAVRDDLPLDLQTDLTLSLLQALDRWSLLHMAELDANPSLAGTQLELVQRLLKP